MATLYLMLGFPGAGKTTTSRLIHQLTGAIHLWADQERHQRFKNPTYSHDENQQLYTHMNYEAQRLLTAGTDVIFDTNFNYYQDRQLLRNIAEQAKASTKLIWVTVPQELAHARATTDTHKNDNGFSINMSDEHFERLAKNLEPPRNDEDYTEIDGTQVNPDYIRSKLELK